MSYNYEEKETEELIDGAGNTVFENIYKNCQNEIKDKIITKLLSKIEEQNKYINTLEKENKKIKDNFIYVLKRILSNKEEYNTYNNLSNISFTNNSTSRNKYESRNKAEYRIRQSSTSREKTQTNYSVIDNKKNSKYIFDINSSIDNMSVGDSPDYKKNNNNINEKKAKKYLNALYRSNFGGAEGTPYSNFINKNTSIYDELFPKNLNTTFIYTETGSKNETPYRRKDSGSFSKRLKSTGIRKKYIMETLEKYKIDKINKILHKNENENGSVTERRNYSIDKRNKKNTRNNVIPNYKYKRNIKNVLNHELDRKYKSKNNISISKRSPYLLNKF